MTIEVIDVAYPNDSRPLHGSSASAEAHELTFDARDVVAFESYLKHESHVVVVQLSSGLTFTALRGAFPSPLRGLLTNLPKNKARTRNGDTDE